jgi:NodT family efflux transporter outer membrane factor (OMF) lipoprotein
MRESDQRWSRCIYLVFLAVAAGGIAGGCAVGPRFQRPPSPPVENYLSDAEKTGRTPSEATGADIESGAAAIPFRWWELFGSSDVNELVTQSIAHSPTLDEQQAVLRQAQDSLRAGYSVYLPNVTGTLTASRERALPVALAQAAPASVFSVFSIAGTVSYLMDVFGGSRRQVEVLSAQASASANSYRAAYLSLTGNVVDTAIARSAYQAQIEAASNIVAAAGDALGLLGAQVQSGVSAETARLAVESQVAQARALLAPLQTRADQAAHLQSVLAGRLPSMGAGGVPPLASYSLPALPSLGVPSELVRRRPDVRVAEDRLHVASAQIGVATAGLFPSITLSAGLGNEATTWKSLGDTAGRFWSGGVDVQLPFFTGGRAWYARKAAVDAYQAMLADYRQVVLVAFQQVADTLRALENDGEVVSARRRDRDDTLATYDAQRASEEAGMSDGVAVAQAYIQYQTAEGAFDSARAVQLQDALALYVALGGGWWDAADGSDVEAESMRSSRP